MIEYRENNKFEFKAKIIQINKVKNLWEIELSKTLFFPESGGQPSDKGFIDNISLFNIKKKNNVIFHYLKERPKNEIVKCNINKSWRLDFMQQHTGQHILSGAFCKIGKYKTLSVHFGEIFTTIEIDVSNINNEDILKVEKLSNSIINKNLDVKVKLIHSDNITNFNLRRKSKITGPLTLVQIGDFDLVACSGLHFDSTGEVGLIKFINIEKIRGNIRTVWKIGERAYKDYEKKNSIIKELNNKLSSKEENLIENIFSLKQELTDQKKKKEIVENKYVKCIISNFFKEDNNNQEQNLILKKFIGEDNNIIKKIVKFLLKREKIIFCLINIYDDKFLWNIGCSDKIKYKFQKNEIFSDIQCSGGGKYPLWQGMCNNLNDVNKFINKFKNHLNNYS